MSPQIRNKIPVVENALRVIDPDGDQSDVERQRKKFGERNRVQYAEMRSHMEVAATIIAAGGSYDMAGNQAGVSERQVRKYMGDADFRARVAELRDTMLGQVQGRIIEEFRKRTEPDKIARLEIMDLARIFDRTTGTSVGTVENPQGMKYDAIIQQIITVNTGDQSPDFPEYEPSQLSVSDQYPQEPD